MGRKISSDKVKQIITLYQKGIPYADISKQVEVGISTVNHYIKESKKNNSDNYNQDVQHQPIEEMERLKKENSNLYDALNMANNKICNYQDIINKLRMMPQKMIIDSIECESLLISRFPILHKNSSDGLYSEYAKLDFGGIITSGNIRTEGGLYMALACVLSLHYNTLDKISKIDNFLDKHSFLQCYSFNQVKSEEIKKIMDEFLEITQ